VTTQSIFCLDAYLAHIPRLACRTSVFSTLALTQSPKFYNASDVPVSLKFFVVTGPEFFLNTTQRGQDQGLPFSLFKTWSRNALSCRVPKVPFPISNWLFFSSAKTPLFYPPRTENPSPVLVFPVLALTRQPPTLGLTTPFFLVLSHPFIQLHSRLPSRPTPHPPTTCPRTPPVFDWRCLVRPKFPKTPALHSF